MKVTNFLLLLILPTFPIYSCKIKRILNFTKKSIQKSI